MRRDVPRRAFRGPDLASVSARARAELGDDALVLRTRTLRPGLIEIVAADAADVERFERRLTPGPLGRLAARDSRPATAVHETRVASRESPPRPLVIALVGPTGAGKTTTAVKLAVHPDAFGARRVGFVTLDTYRAGAVAQLETYAGVAGIPLEVAYDAGDVAGAMARLAGCDVVIVDTPGRGPRAADGADWRAALAALAPDETHLVLPATVRHDVAEHARESLEAPGSGVTVTHLAVTKLDEVPDERGVADLASAVGLPARWVCDGQEIPADLAAAVPRLVRSLGADAGAGARSPAA